MTKPFISVGKNFKIVKSDDLNLEVHRFTSVTSHANKHQAESRTIEKWKWCGYASSLAGALRIIQKQMEVDAIGDELKELSDIKTFVDDTAQTLIDVVKSTGVTRQNFESFIDGKVTIDVAKVSDDTQHTENEPSEKIAVEG